MRTHRIRIAVDHCGGRFGGRRPVAVVQEHIVGIFPIFAAQLDITFIVEVVLDLIILVGFFVIEAGFVVVQVVGLCFDVLLAGFLGIGHRHRVHQHRDGVIVFAQIHGRGPLLRRIECGGPETVTGCRGATHHPGTTTGKFGHFQGLQVNVLGNVLVDSQLDLAAAGLHGHVQTAQDDGNDGEAEQKNEKFAQTHGNQR